MTTPPTTDPLKHALEMSIFLEAKKRVVCHRHGKLVVELTRTGLALTGRVVEQDDDLRFAGIIAEWLDPDGKKYTAESFAWPDIDSTVLLVRGNGPKDDGKVFSWTYRTATDAEAAEFAFRVMVAAISEGQR